MTTRGEPPSRLNQAQRVKEEGIQRARSDAEHWIREEEICDVWEKEKNRECDALVEAAWEVDLVGVRADAADEVRADAVRVARKLATAELVTSDDLALPQGVQVFTIGDAEYFDMTMEDYSTPTPSESGDDPMEGASDGALDDPPDDQPSAPPAVPVGPAFTSVLRLCVPGKIDLDDIPDAQPQPVDPPTGSDGGGAGLEDRDNASSHVPADPAPAAPSAPSEPPIHPPPDVVIQQRPNTVVYVIPGPPNHDINIGYTFRPSGDVAADIAEERRVGHIAGRITAENPAPRGMSIRLSERLLHRHAVIEAAEAAGFVWADREEAVFKAGAVFKAPAAAPPPNFFEALQRTSDPRNRLNGNLKSAKMITREALLAEIHDPQLQQALIRSLETVEVSPPSSGVASGQAADENEPGEPAQSTPGEPVLDAVELAHTLPGVTAADGPPADGTGSEEPPAAPPASAASEFLMLRPSSIVTIIDANGASNLDVPDSAKPPTPDPAEASVPSREERKSWMASDSPLFGADDPPGQEDCDNASSQEPTPTVAVLAAPAGGGETICSSPICGLRYSSTLFEFCPKCGKENISWAYVAEKERVEEQMASRRHRSNDAPEQPPAKAARRMSSLRQPISSPRPRKTVKFSDIEARRREAQKEKEEQARRPPPLDPKYNPCETSSCCARY